MSDTDISIPSNEEEFISDSEDLSMSQIYTTAKSISTTYHQENISSSQQENNSSSQQENVSVIKPEIPVSDCLNSLGDSSLNENQILELGPRREESPFLEEKYSFSVGCNYFNERNSFEDGSTYFTW